MAYLPRVLVLYRSIAATCVDFRLWVGCLEPGVKSVLDEMRLPGLSTIDLPEVEEYDPALKEVKPTRRLVEYIGTMRPSLCLLVMEREPDVEVLTLLGADLRFFEDPAPLFDELGGGSLLLVPHRFLPERRGYFEGIYGPYNGDWITFRRSDEGLDALRWFRDRTIEWCFLRLEDGKFNDQRYLDSWPQRYTGARVLDHLGAGPAPWSASQYHFERRDGRILVEGQPLIFYHFANMELYRGLTAPRRIGLLAGTYRFAPAPLPLVWRRDQGQGVADGEIDLLWAPYVREVGRAILDVRRLKPDYAAGFADGPADARRRAQTVALVAARRKLKRRRRSLQRVGKRGLSRLDGAGKRLDHTLKEFERKSSPRNRHLEPPR